MNNCCCKIERSFGVLFIAFRCYLGRTNDTSSVPGARWNRYEGGFLEDKRHGGGTLKLAGGGRYALILFPGAASRTSYSRLDHVERRNLMSLVENTLQAKLGRCSRPSSSLDTCPFRGSTYECGLFFGHTKIS